MAGQTILKWLLEGDVSIQYQVHRDLLGLEQPALRARIAREGWGGAFLSLRAPNGHWGRGFYQPKWTSTHYTLLDLKNLAISPQVDEIRQTIALVLKEKKGADGGIYPIGLEKRCDVCLNGMFLNYAAYFGAEESSLSSIVDFLLARQMADGGFNCLIHRGAVHSSLHSTLSVLEGILEYVKGGYGHGAPALEKAAREAEGFILRHHLFLSCHTGAVISPKMAMLSYPSRWRYDILRALDYFQAAGARHDARMDEALAVLMRKQRKDGRWPLQAKHPGQTHFEMERTGEASRWNTLRALRVLKHFAPETWSLPMAR